MDKSYNHHETEKNWYQKWEERGVFQAENNSSKKNFSLILPPPNVTGSLHIGHALTFCIPDIIVRRKKMQNYNVLWLPGFDHAGIATQVIVEKHLKDTQNKTKEDLGREKFLELVWKWKDDSEKRIVAQIKKLGLALDWSRTKFTLSPEMQEVVKKVFVLLYREGKIYRGSYLSNHCPRCKTVLSDLEVEHREVKTKLTYIRYPLADDQSQYIVVATTRPETMLGDTAVAVNPDDPRYKHLIGKLVILPLTGRVIPIVFDSQVEKDFGSGAVKITPAHDPFDFQLAQRHKLEQVKVIDSLGKMCGPIPEKYSGQDRFVCRQMILEDLAAAGLIEKEEDHLHSIGHCHRCQTIVEPLLSTQWFLKMKEIAQPAIAAVEKHAIRFIPEKWEKIYFNWMHNIQDWCLSRQLWWGHRIPAYYCQQCGEIIVDEERPSACPKCSSKDLKQDEDVLDTWFSSALWPFSTLGWKDQQADFKEFYPTSLMVTAFDIIFFWVARMIMMGIHVAGDIPFREVLINGLIRDEKGQKMSKTKNNVIDPLDIIQEYGADALRFTLAIQSVPGMDLALSINRIKGYKAFANKIWNASRYVLTNLRGDENEDIESERLTTTDRWILHLLNATTEKINELFDNYKLYEAADLLYHFIWDEFCDWYVEFSKNDLENRATRCVLKISLIRILKLLHPFMPFITEEIYSRFKADQRVLVETDFPAFSADFVFSRDFKKIEFLKQLIAETRKTRTENQIDPGKRVEIFLKFSNTEEEAILSENLRYFNFLCRSKQTTIVNSFESLKKGFRGVFASCEILLPIEDSTELEREIKRLSSEAQKLQAQIASIQQKLSNAEFVQKAPPEIITNFRRNLQLAIEKEEKIRLTLYDLKR